MTDTLLPYTTLFRAGRTGTQPPLRRTVVRDRGRRPACARTGLCRLRLRGVAPPAADAAPPVPGPCRPATALVATPAVAALVRGSVRRLVHPRRAGATVHRRLRVREVQIGVLSGSDWGCQFR